MLNILADWAEDWAIPQDALDDLYARQMKIAESHVTMKPDGSEAYTQSLVKLATYMTTYKMWRNNVGVFQNPNGRPVRVGLANDTASLNETIKSADLIGWSSQIVTHEWFEVMKGKRVAVFTSIECKRADWKPNPNDEHEKAQKRWADMVVAAGGIACFSTGGLPALPDTWGFRT